MLLCSSEHLRSEVERAAYFCHPNGQPRRCPAVAPRNRKAKAAGRSGVGTRGVASSRHFDGGNPGDWRGGGVVRAERRAGQAEGRR